MQSIIRLFKRIFSDIGSGKNIEAYVVSLVAVILAAIGVIDDIVPDSVKFAAILAALALLLFKSTAPEDNTVDLDSVLRDRQSFTPFHEFIEGAKVLWVYGPSAVNVLRHADEIKRTILDRGGEVRVLLQDPDADDGLNILLKQLDKIHDLRDDIKTSLRTLQAISERSNTGTLEYGVLPYSPGFSLIIVDPDGRDGRLVIEFYGYENDMISQRMHIPIRREQSQYWFEYWDEQYQVMWESARKLNSVAKSQPRA
jgi:hypothetical protein